MPMNGVRSAIITKMPSPITYRDTRLTAAAPDVRKTSVITAEKNCPTVPVNSRGRDTGGRSTG